MLTCSCQAEGAGRHLTCHVIISKVVQRRWAVKLARALALAHGKPDKSLAGQTVAFQRSTRLRGYGP